MWISSALRALHQRAVILRTRKKIDAYEHEPDKSGVLYALTGRRTKVGPFLIN